MVLLCKPTDCKRVQCTCKLHIHNHTKLDSKLDSVRTAILALSSFESGMRLTV